MIPTIWEIIFLSITVVPTLMLLTNTMNGEIDIRKVALKIAFIFALSLIYGMIQQIAWGSVLPMFFTIASISFSVLCVKKRLDRHVDVGDLGVAVGKLHGMETTLSCLDQIPFAEQYRIWLESVGDLQRKAQDTKVGYARSGLNYSNRLHFSRRACQELKIANDLLRQGDNILHPQDQLQRGMTNFYKKVVIDFIKDMADDSGLLGIWGKGGVGKTSLLKLLVGDSRSEYDDGSFQVLFVPAAGTGCTVGQVQEAIATSMGLSLESSETSQAKIIHDHLKYTSFLLLIDDLRGDIDLKAVGIPSPLGRVLVSLQGTLERKARRKVVLTTRNMDLCDKMGCSRDNTIQMECFDEDAFFDEPPKVLPAQASSSSSHRRRQLATRQPYSDVELQRPQDNNQMISYQKMCNFIEDNNAKSRLLGVWGMRGVGKTTLLRLARDSYQCKAGFDHIMFVGAGTGHIVNNVQHAIAINLGLDLAMMSSMDELSRAMCIFNYLEHRSFLLLLDDIREPFNWWAIGLPLLLYEQKIILATRSRSACRLMGCETVDTIEMQCLGKRDAWHLFMDKAGLGLIDNHPQVDHLSKQMVSMCGGLPLALGSLGRAMSNKRDLREWRCAYSQLSAIGLEPCEIDEKVGDLILSTPLYGWRKDTILPADEQIQAKTTTVHEQKQETALSHPSIFFTLEVTTWALNKLLDRLEDATIEAKLEGHTTEGKHLVDALDRTKLILGSFSAGVTAGVEIGNVLQLAPQITEVRDKALKLAKQLHKLEYYEIVEKVKKMNLKDSNQFTSKMKSIAQVGQSKGKIKYSVLKDISGTVVSLHKICDGAHKALSLEKLYKLYGATQNTSTDTRETVESFTETKEFEREEKADILKIISTSASSDQDLLVLPIVGGGGVGKTTLARLVYHDPEVKAKFDIMIWIYVSANFDEIKLTQGILEHIVPEWEYKNTKNLNVLQRTINKYLQNKRFLLVLDDMWEESKGCWDKLLAPLRCTDSKGNVILVTTRKLSVANIASKMEGHVKLDGMNDNVFWRFFKTCIFGDEKYKGDGKLQNTAKNIALKLNGNPLAAKIVAALLRRNRTDVYWKRILNREEWKLPNAADDIIPALKISYNHLPYHLQQLFSYCALFPKGHKFDKEQLIHMWIALGFVMDERKRLEDAGSDSFDDLVDRSFFQNDGKYFIVHDLMHDVAQEVSSLKGLPSSGRVEYNIKECPQLPADTIST